MCIKSVINIFFYIIQLHHSHHVLLYFLNSQFYQLKIKHCIIYSKIWLCAISI